MMRKPHPMAVLLGLVFFLGLLFGGLLLIPFECAQAQINTLPTAGSTFFSDLTTFLREEDADRYVQLQFADFVNNTCLFASPGGVGQNLSCQGFVEGKWVNQTAVVTLAAGDPDTCWLAIDDATTGTPVGIGNFTRTAGTVFLTDCVTTTQPTQPTGTLLAEEITVAAGLVTAVRRIAPESPFTAGTNSIPMVHVAQFGAVCDGVTSDNASVQAALDYLDTYAEHGIVFVGRTCIWTPQGVTWDADSDDYVLASNGSSLSLFFNGTTDLRLMDATTGATGALGELVFGGRDSGNNLTEYAGIEGQADDVTDGTEDGHLRLNMRAAGIATFSELYGLGGGLIMGDDAAFADVSSSAFSAGGLVIHEDSGSRIGLYDGSNDGTGPLEIQGFLDDTGGTTRAVGGLRMNGTGTWADAANSSGTFDLDVRSGAAGGVVSFLQADGGTNNRLLLGRSSSGYVQARTQFTYNGIAAFGVGDTSPSVAVGNFFSTPDGTTYTHLDDGQTGQVVHILCLSAAVFDDNAGGVVDFQMSGSIDFTCAANTMVSFIKSATDWYEIARSAD